MESSYRPLILIPTDSCSIYYYNIIFNIMIITIITSHPTYRLVVRYTVEDYLPLLILHLASSQKELTRSPRKVSQSDKRVFGERGLWGIIIFTIEYLRSRVLLIQSALDFPPGGLPAHRYTSWMKHVIEWRA